MGVTNMCTRSWQVVLIWCPGALRSVCMRFVGTVADSECGGEGLLRCQRQARDTRRRSLKGKLIAWEKSAFL